MTRARLVIGVVGNDIHVVANVLLARGLRRAGYDVCNLGISNSPQHFIDAASEHEADAVLIGSINGEAENWLMNIRKDLSAVGLHKTLLVVGGNLTIGDQPSALVEARYLSMGFSRAYHRPASLDRMMEDLELELANRE